VGREEYVGMKIEHLHQLLLLHMVVRQRGMEILVEAEIVILVGEARTGMHGEQQGASQVLRHATTVDRFVLVVT